MTADKNTLPAGPWLDDGGLPTPGFRDLLVNMIEADRATAAPDSGEDKERLEQLQAVLDLKKPEAAKRVKIRSFETGALAGSAFTINHGLGTRDIYYTIHKDGEGVIVSVEIFDENTMKIQINAPTTLQAVNIYTFS